METMEKPLPAKVKVLKEEACEVTFSIELPKEEVEKETEPPTFPEKAYDAVFLCDGHKGKRHSGDVGDVRFEVRHAHDHRAARGGRGRCRVGAVRGDCPDNAVPATISTHLPEHAGVLSSTHCGNELLLQACLQDNSSR